MTFAPLEAADLARLAEQRAVVDNLTRTHLGRGLAGEPSDLQLLQALLDAEVLLESQTYELQCLGIVFGDLLLAALDGFAWVMIDDDYGRDPVIRYRESTLQLGPLTMISKRIERGESVDVTALFMWTVTKALELRAEAD